MNKDPNIIKEIISIITSSNVWLGALMAVVMTWLRNLYDETERDHKRELVECALSGGITLSIASALDYFKMPSEIAIFIGGAVGLFGVNWVRRKANNFVNKNISSDSNSEEQDHD